MREPIDRFYHFGPFSINAEKRMLLHEGCAVPLAPKAFDTLLALVQHHGQVLGKDELMDLLWPDSEVEEGNLPLHISALRKALGESPNERGYIVTVPGRGYRFAAEVEEFDQEGQGLVVGKNTGSTISTQEQGDAPDEASRALPVPRSSLARLKPTLAGVIILAVILPLASVSWLWLSKTPGRQPANVLIQSLAVLPFRHLGAGAMTTSGLALPIRRLRG